jgi:hypothetical protein
LGNGRTIPQRTTNQVHSRQLKTVQKAQGKGTDWWMNLEGYWICWKHRSAKIARREVPVIKLIMQI